MNQREIALKSIATEFANWETKISNLNSIRFYDTNIISEHTICELLNSIYDYNLQNINAVRENFPAIDLVDEQNKIAIQVTSTRSTQKVQSTIDKFLTSKLDTQYDELFIVILGTKQSRYPDFKVTNGFSFNKERNIIDFQDLLKVISFLPSSKIEKIRKIVTIENILPKNKTVSNAAKLKRNLVLKDRMKKQLLRKLPPDQWQDSIYEPWIRFKYGNILIRSVDDKKFPEVDENPPGGTSSWLKGEPWDFYENGIEFIFMGTRAIFDQDGYWDLLEYEDPRANDPSYKIVNCNPFARIPYDFIVKLDMETDLYYGIPSLYVEYAKDNAPWGEVHYGIRGLLKNRTLTYYFDNAKRKTLKIPSK